MLHGALGIKTESPPFLYPRGYHATSRIDLATACAFSRLPHAATMSGMRIIPCQLLGMCTAHYQAGFGGAASCDETCCSGLEEFQHCLSALWMQLPAGGVPVIHPPRMTGCSCRDIKVTTHDRLALPREKAIMTSVSGEGLRTSFISKTRG